MNNSLRYSDLLDIMSKSRLGTYLGTVSGDLSSTLNELDNGRSVESLFDSFTSLMNDLVNNCFSNFDDEFVFPFLHYTRNYAMILGSCDSLDITERLELDTKFRKLLLILSIMKCKYKDNEFYKKVFKYYGLKFSTLECGFDFCDDFIENFID